MDKWKMPEGEKTPNALRGQMPTDAQIIGNLMQGFEKNRDALLRLERDLERNVVSPVDAAKKLHMLAVRCDHAKKTAQAQRALRDGPRGTEEQALLEALGAVPVELSAIGQTARGNA